MKQRGFISSIYIYLIAAALVAGLGYGLYKMTVKVGELNAKNEQLESDKKTLSDQIVNQNKAQLDAQNDKEKAERDASRARRELVDIRRKYAELLDQLLPVELYDRLRNAIIQANGDLPTAKPDGKMPNP